MKKTNEKRRDRLISFDSPIAQIKINKALSLVDVDTPVSCAIKQKSLVAKKPRPMRNTFDGVLAPRQCTPCPVLENCNHGSFSHLFNTEDKFDSGHEAYKDQTQSSASSESKSETRKSGGGLEFLYLFGGFSNEVEPDIKTPRGRDAVDGLGLQRQNLHSIQKTFGFSKDVSGTVNTADFLAIVGDRPTTFTDNLFAMIDLDYNGTIDFEMLISVMATFCMFSKKDIPIFVFECFTRRCPGSMDESDYNELVKAVDAGESGAPGEVPSWATVGPFDAASKGHLSEAEFLELDRAHPCLSSYAFRLQLNLQVATMGQKFFTKLTEKQHRARVLEDYKVTHGGRLPKEHPLAKLMSIGVPFVAEELELRTKNNDNLIALGRLMYYRSTGRAGMVYT
jgi:hypothetical protein